MHYYFFRCHNILMMQRAIINAFWQTVFFYQYILDFFSRGNVCHLFYDPSVVVAQPNRNVLAINHFEVLPQLLAKFSLVESGAVYFGLR
ncbi:hypothetical protein SAMN04487935_1181 [Flavobacterium noncentrifugens]|uniref:Uncharacterized protein n=1 Tax=Flavobacterium noncentrifugens TaxID=1128970 RepID=A0A1G8V4J0_9FLAO|nr:hypothetical protein SAMN04487935_1181 [Flavobacterium noncentrifugens]